MLTSSFDGSSFGGCAAGGIGLGCCCVAGAWAVWAVWSAGLPGSGSCALAADGARVTAASTTAKNNQTIPGERLLGLFIEIEFIRFRIIFPHDCPRAR